MTTFLTKHLESVGESYAEHLKFGLAAGLMCLVLGVISLIHAVLPFLMPRLPEKLYQYISESMVNPRLKRINAVRRAKPNPSA